MVVQHNMQAMNANRMLGVTQNLQSKSTEKLSSGYKINRAADDAAGLSISEKMRKQIRGLEQASANAEDGISAVQTAEGALTEVHDMLQRMNELAVQAANGTNSTSDRQSIQDEISQLSTEIDRVAETTKFNETYLLKGDTSGTRIQYADPQDAGIEGISFVDCSVGGAGSGQRSCVYFDKDIWKAGNSVTIAGKEYNIVADAKADTVDAGGTTEAQVYGNVATYAANKNLSLIQAQAVASAEIAKASSAGTDNTALVAKGYNGGSNLVQGDWGVFTTTSVEDGNPIGTQRFMITTGSSTVAKDLSFNLHVGADADMTNKIGVTIKSMSSAGIGVKNLDITGTDGMKATYAIDTISTAIGRVSEQRSALGAIQNRLEHTVNNLDNVVENTTSAESRIRDTDMAKEMVNYSKTNILAQAGQSMLAQANSSNQGVLSLLR